MKKAKYSELYENPEFTITYIKSQLKILIASEKKGDEDVVRKIISNLNCLMVVLKDDSEVYEVLNEILMDEEADKKYGQIRKLKLMEKFKATFKEQIKNRNSNG